MIISLGIIILEVIKKLSNDNELLNLIRIMLFKWINKVNRLFIKYIINKLTKNNHIHNNNKWYLFALKNTIDY